MNLLQDILGLFTRKLYTKTVKDRDFIVVGIDNNPTGILKPQPPQLKLMESVDFINSATLLSNKLVSGNYNILSSDINKLLICTDTTNITLPLNLATPIGTQIIVASATPNTITFIADPGVTLNSRGNLVTIIDQYAAVSLIKTDSNTWYLIGDLS